MSHMTQRDNAVLPPYSYGEGGRLHPDSKPPRIRSKLAKRPERRSGDDWRTSLMADDDGVVHDPEFVGFRTVQHKKPKTETSSVSSESSSSYPSLTVPNASYSITSPTPRRTSEDFARPVVNTSNYRAAAAAHRADTRRVRSRRPPSTVPSSAAAPSANDNHLHWAPPRVPEFLESPYVPSRVGLAVNPSGNWGADVMGNTAYNSEPFGTAARHSVDNDTFGSGCSSLGRRWRAFKLDIRFGTFRMGKSIRRHLHV